jgi:hypothetical protein
MELTKEYFDQALQSLTTKDNLKNALAEQTKELKAYADEQTENLARIIATSIAEPTNKVERRVQKLETDMQKIKQALQIS